MAKARTIYIVCHFWPNSDGYTIMPECYTTQRKAMAATMAYCRNDKGVLFESETLFKGDQHGYAVKPLDLA